MFKFLILCTVGTLTACKEVPPFAPEPQPTPAPPPGTDYDHALYSGDIANLEISVNTTAV